MSTNFRKGKPVKPPHAAAKKASAKSRKPKKAGDSKAPAARVHQDPTYHDTISPLVLYVLVDHPIDGQDAVTLDQGSQTWPLMFTSDAQPLTDTYLVSALAFEHVASTGALSLKIRHGESQQDTEYITDVNSAQDPDLVYGPKTPEADDPPLRLRRLNYDTLPMHPIPVDPDLRWDYIPWESLLTDDGS